MLYREYGKTGKKVSILGFGGMRFADIDDRERCVRTMVAAAQGGVNYFDTAPDYFGTKSEETYGEGLAELRRLGIPHYVATKTFKSKPDEIRAEIEAQLLRLGVPSIDFYHVWCITTLENYQKRKNDGVLDAFRSLKEEGLIKHICVSSHLIGSQIVELLQEGLFEGVLFGYSAYNFRTREAAFNAIRERGLGAVIMNPLGGGLIPQHPELFQFLKRDPSEPVVHSALRFLWDHQDLSTALVGFSREEEVRVALDAVEGYIPRTEAELADLKAKASASFEGICTGCAYCDDCPQGIPIPKYMDAYNQKLLSADEKALENRLKYHWTLKTDQAGTCIECGQCEAACTQHLPIIARLKEIAG